jgi:hypothetical protein
VLKDFAASLYNKMDFGKAIQSDSKPLKPAWQGFNVMLYAGSNVVNDSSELHPPILDMDSDIITYLTS